MLQMAAQDESGGLYKDEFSGKIEPAYWLGDVMDKPMEKQADPLYDFGAWLEESQKLATEDDTAPLSWEDYVDYANSDVKSDEAKIDVGNKQLKSEWARRTAISTFNPALMKEDEIGRVVGDQMVINPANYSEIDKVENWINSQDKFSDAEKKLNLLEYRKKVEEKGGEIVNQFSAADAGVLMSVFTSPLRDEYQDAMGKGQSAYEFIKANKERFSKDSYGVGSELVTKFRDAMMATGTGALFLAGKGLDSVGLDGVGEFLSKPAQAWGGLAEDSAAGFSNNEVFSIGGIGINRRDLTELTGQVGSFLAMGGLGAAGAKGLSKMGMNTASKGATVMGAEEAAKFATRSFGKKALDFGKAAITDTTAYMGGIQAGGMSFGRTYNDVMKLLSPPPSQQG
jgi:hypothetical protein